MDVVPTIYEGKQYKTWNEFAVEYEEFLKNSFHPIFVINSNNRTNKYNEVVKNKLPSDFCYARVVFGCIHGKITPSHSQGFRKTVSKKLNCTARVRINLTRNNCFELKECQLNHVNKNGVKVHDINEFLFKSYRTQMRYLEKNHLIPREVHVYCEMEKKVTSIITRNKDNKERCVYKSNMCLAKDVDSEIDNEPKKKLQKIMVPSDSGSVTVLPCSSQSPCDDEANKKQQEDDRLENKFNAIGKQNIPIVNIVTDKSGQKHINVTKPPKKIVIILRNNKAITPVHGSEITDVVKYDENMKETNVSNTNQYISLESPRSSGQTNNVITTISKKMTHKHLEILRNPCSVDIESSTENDSGAQIKGLKLDIDSSRRSTDNDTTNIVQLDTDSSDDEGLIEPLEQDCVELTDPLKLEVPEDIISMPTVTVSNGFITLMFAENTNNHNVIAETTETHKNTEKPATPMVSAKPSDAIIHKMPTNNKSPANPKTAGKPWDLGVAAKRGIVEESAKKIFLCRGCMSSQPPLEPLVGDLAKLYREFIDNDISVGDVYPKFICKACSATLLQFTAFREKCLWTQKIFIKNHTAKAKLTPESSDDTSEPMFVKTYQPPSEFNSPNVLKSNNKQNYSPNVRGKQLEDIRINDSKRLRAVTQEKNAITPEETHISIEEMHLSSEAMSEERNCLKSKEKPEAMCKKTLQKMREKTPEYRHVKDRVERRVKFRNVRITPGDRNLDLHKHFLFNEVKSKTQIANPDLFTLINSYPNIRCKRLKETDVKSAELKYRESSENMGINYLEDIEELS